MSLRKGTIFTIILVFMLVIAVAFFVSRYTLLDEYKNLEVQGEQSNAKRIVGVLENRVIWLAGSTSDWAYWDDSYNFVRDRNSTYITTNLSATTFASLQIDAILYFDTRGELVYGKAYDVAAGKEVPLPAALLEHIKGSDALKFPGQDGVAGLVDLPGTPMMVASYLILTSSKTGPAAGALIMARYFDDAEIELLSNTAVLPLSFYSVLDSPLPADVETARQELAAGTGSVYVTTPDSRVIDTYIAVSDIYGQPAGIFQTEHERTVYEQGRKSVVTTLGLIGGAALLAGVTAIIFQDRRVLSPLGNLRDSVHRVSTSGDTSARVAVRGNDELSALGKDINAMLTTIEKSGEDEKKLRQELEQEIQKRSEYTRELVHELKTPITPILSSSELLVDGVKGEPWNRLAKNIYRGALDMNDRLDDLVDIARGEVGTLRLRKEPMDVAPVLRQMVEEMSPLITSRLQSLQVILPPSLPAISGDETRIRQILRNLLSNATKYTPEKGQITVRAEQQDAGIVVNIEDTGRGIAPDQLERIFEPYAKITDGILERQTGLGLGLKLARTLVELHGGRMWVTSEKGKGSIFSFYLPAISDFPPSGQDRVN